MTISVFLSLFTVERILLAIIGVIIGIVFGAIPGLASSTALALMLPVAFSMDSYTAIIFLSNVWIGGCSGGLIAAILLGIPGQSSSIATCYDGYPLSQKGESVKALGIGILSSFIGTVGGVLIAYLFCPFIARWAVKLGPWELFSLCFCAIILVVTISKGDIWNGLIAASLGLIFSSVGFSPIDGAKRMTFGIISIYGGINLLALILGIFALGQILKNVAKGKTTNPNVNVSGIRGFGLTMKEFVSNIPNIIRSFMIGLWIGFLPGMGSGLSNMVAYASAKGSSKHPEEFGTGCIEGVFASEVANNASVGGAIIPMITLGIPGDTPTSILLGALTIFGVEAGPLLMTNSAQFANTFFAACLLAAAITLAVQFFGMRSFPLMLKIPFEYLFSAITVICFVGAFSNTNTLSNCWLMLVFAIIGFFLYYADLPTAPLLLGFILGPMLEKNLRKGLTYASNGIWSFFTRPISCILLLVAIGSLIWPIIRSAIKKHKAASKGEVQV